MQAPAIARPSASQAGAAMFRPSQLTTARDTARMAATTSTVFRIRSKVRMPPFDGAACESSSAAPLYLAYGRHDLRSQSRQKSGELRVPDAALVPGARGLRLSTAHVPHPPRRALHLGPDLCPLPAARLGACQARHRRRPHSRGDAAE